MENRLRFGKVEKVRDHVGISDQKYLDAYLVHFNVQPPTTGIHGEKFALRLMTHIHMNAEWPVLLLMTGSNAGTIRKPSRTLIIVRSRRT